MSVALCTDVDYHPEPSRYIYISGLRNPRPLNELRYWFSRGRYIYDELRCPVVPASVAGQGPDRLSTANSGAHPVWEDTLNEERPGQADQHLEAQFAEIQRIQDAIALEEEEKKVAEQEEDRLDEKAKRKKEIRAKTWTGSRGKYGNEPGAKPHSLAGRGVYQNITPSHSPASFVPALEYPMGAISLGQVQHFQPYSPGSQNYLTDTFTPGFAHPAYPTIRNDVVFNDAVYNMEQQILHSPPQPFPVQLNHVDSQPAMWASPAPTPTMNVLSPRAMMFVPAGLFSPEVHHGVPVAMMGAAVDPSPSVSERKHSHQLSVSSQRSTLNPAAGDFQPSMAPSAGKEW